MKVVRNLLDPATSRLERFENPPITPLTVAGIPLMEIEDMMNKHTSKDRVWESLTSQYAFASEYKMSLLILDITFIYIHVT